MGVMKNNDLEIQEFSFRSLIPEAQSDGKINEFELKSLNEAQAFKNNISEIDIRQEREAASKTAFKILDEVKDHRGLTRQAQEDYEQAVARAVEAELGRLREDAYREGLEKGLEEGRAQAYHEAQKELEEKLEEFTQHIAVAQEQINDVLASSKDDAYNIIKSLTKWIVLKEVDEKYYLARLLEKLVHEINQKNNLVLHVNESAFGYMPEIIKIVERKVGRLTNTRVEVDLDLQENGIILETENCVIDGSLQAQFKALDDLFRVVGLNGAE